MSDRPQQFIGLVILYRELAEHLKLPRDHRIVKVDTTEPRYGAPGILVTVEGPAGYLTARGSAVCFSYSFSQWLTEVDEMRESSIAQYGPYEW